MAELRPMRIGDVERDQAVSALGEHFAAGRLTKDEYDERAAQVWTARFRHDLSPLFSDLPSPDLPSAAVASGIASGAERRRVHATKLNGMPAFLWILPVMAFTALTVAVVLSAPWMMFFVFWFVMMGGFGRGRRHWRHRQGWPSSHPGWAGHRHG